MQQPEVVQAGHQGSFLQEEPDFSLVLGGPLYQLYVAIRLAQKNLVVIKIKITSTSYF